MPHPSPLRLSCSLGVALLAAAGSHAQPQPATNAPHHTTTAAQAPPAAHGSATLVLGDARITVSVDACPGVKSDIFRACENE